MWWAPVQEGAVPRAFHGSDWVSTATFLHALPHLLVVSKQLLQHLTGAKNAADVAVAQRAKDELECLVRKLQKVEARD